MPNPRLATRYAKSILDLAIEKGQLEEVYADMQYLQLLNNSSREFLNLLRSPIVASDKKQSAVDAVTAGKISVITTSFTLLFITK
jgi:F-type H+-transporting ATPase subunit delta